MGPGVWYAPTLRFSNTNLLSAPFVRTSSGARSFSVAAPEIWNFLHLYVFVPVLIPSVVTSHQLLPAGLPIHLTRLLLRLRFGFADHCARL